MSARWIRPLCLAALALAWAIDLVTPQLLVVAILFNVPIALSSLALDSRFTRALVALALLADAIAGYVNGVHDGYRWESIALADRTIGALSFLLVGGLSIVAQRAASRAGELAARADRTAREAGVRRAVEALRGSVNPELIGRAFVREAIASLAVETALFFAFDRAIDAPTTYRSTRARPGEADIVDGRPDPALLSFFRRLVERDERVVAIEASDPFGRLLLETLGASHAIAARVVEHDATFGVLVLVREGTPFETHFDEGLSPYVDQAAIALAQAGLFVRLGERNDALRDANERLRERGDVIRDLVYALSHDLRTPLAAARVTMLQAQAGAFGALPEAYREILARSIASNDELERLAETLLLVSRYESGEASTHRERIDTGRLAHDVVRELTSLWESKALRVRAFVPDDPLAVDVLGDERELRRALVNMLANAIAWTPHGRAIDVTVAARGAMVTVIVEDAGYGVPPEDVPSLFQRVRATPARRGAGSGLGLYLVRRIAEAHGGSVSYAPRVGGGSVFSLTFPRVVAPVIEREVARDAAAENAS